MHRIIIGFMLIAFLAACGNSRSDEFPFPLFRPPTTSRRACRRPPYYSRIRG